MKFSTWLGILGASIFAMYLSAVIASGLGWNPFGVIWNFENSGQFGDSFGPLGAMMSAVAAVSALLAYWSQRDELNRLKTSAEADRLRAEKNDFEGMFFQLVTLFRNTLVQIDVDQQTAQPARGADAFKRLISDYMYRIKVDDISAGNEKNFKNMYLNNQNDLGHYFRLFYHIVKFIDESEIDGKMRYIRIFRATLSNSEIVMIGLNCCYGAGFEKLKPLVEKYALLHNISANSANKFEINSKMKSDAFGDRTIDANGLLTS